MAAATGTLFQKWSLVPTNFNTVLIMFPVLSLVLANIKGFYEVAPLIATFGYWSLTILTVLHVTNE